MYTNKYFKGKRHPITITLIGCGGTGSQLLQELARMNHAMISMDHPGMQVTVYDGDCVTDANFGRQLFSVDDVGRNKAIVCVERINRFFKFAWDAIPEHFCHDNVSHTNLYITTMDSMYARAQIYPLITHIDRFEYDDEVKKHGWIDIGNDKNSGQVWFGGFKTGIQDLFQAFPELLQAKKKKVKHSCSVAESLFKQDIMINKYMAMVAAKLIWELVFNGQTNWHAAFINSSTLNIKTKPC